MVVQYEETDVVEELSESTATLEDYLKGIRDLLGVASQEDDQ